MGAGVVDDDLRGAGFEDGGEGGFGGGGVADVAGEGFGGEARADDLGGEGLGAGETGMGVDQDVVAVGGEAAGRWRRRAGWRRR